MEKTAVFYVHGKGGSAEESTHYAPLFPNCTVVGSLYRSEMPWTVGAEIREEIIKLHRYCDRIILVANSIGAFFSMNAGIEEYVDEAFFISPIVDMKKLITDMMLWAGVTEEELRTKSEIKTDFGETLSWEYLTYVRNHSILWKVPTKILYGCRDNLTDFETVKGFAERIRAELTVMEDGEHWFHTEAQMTFLDRWITGSTYRIGF